MQRHHHTSAMPIAIALLGIGLFAGCGSELETTTTTAPGTTGGKGQHLASCVSMFGSTYCPIGPGVSVNINGGQVDAGGFGALGTDGIRSTFTATDNWEHDGLGEFAIGGPVRQVFAVFSGGTQISTLRLEKVPGNLDLTVQPDFTAGELMRYRAEVYANEELVASVDNRTISQSLLVNGGVKEDLPRGIYFIKVTKGGPSRPRPTGFNVAPVASGHDGACRWDLQWEGNLTIDLAPGISATGNRIVLIEQTAPGTYPYHTFDRMDITGTMQTYSVFDEATF